MDREEQKRQLEDLKVFLFEQREQIKPLFGFMFWQFSSLGCVAPPESLLKSGLNLTMDSGDDELQASFFANYVQLWDSAGDLNGASRFISSALQMSADELIQCRQLWLDHPLNEQK